MPPLPCRIASCLVRLGDDAAGATVVEYALIGGVIAAAIIVAVTQIGADLGRVITNLGTTVQSTLL